MARLQSCHWASSAKKHGYSCEWASGQKPHLPKNGKIIQLKTEIFVPQCCLRMVFKFERKFVFCIVTAGLIEYLSESSNTTKLRNSRSSIERPRRSSKNRKTKNISNNQATRSRLRGLPEWLEDFKDNLEDPEVPALANTSHDSDWERLTKVATRKHRIYTPPSPPSPSPSLPKDRKLRNL